MKKPTGLQCDVGVRDWLLDILKRYYFIHSIQRDTVGPTFIEYSSRPELALGRADNVCRATTVIAPLFHDAHRMPLFGASTAVLITVRPVLKFQLRPLICTKDSNKTVFRKVRASCWQIYAGNATRKYHIESLEMLRPRWAQRWKRPR